MKYSVNAVKSFRGMEGHGFNANLLQDGKKVAFVIDEANGGEYHYEWLDHNEPRVEGKYRNYKDEILTRKMTPAEKAFNEYVLSFPSEDMGAGLGVMYLNEDCVMGKLVGEFEQDKQMIGWCKKSVVFSVKGDKEGEFRTLKTLWKGNEVKIKEYIGKKYGSDCEILNERYA